VLRWESPSANRLRIANRDFDFRDRRIRASDWVVAFITSANRDERVFEQPDRFDIRRYPNRQLAFGEDTRGCLGRHLARLEMPVLFQRLFESFDVELAEEPTWVADARGNGVAHMPVLVTPIPPRTTVGAPA
jgi:cytochrome P450